MKRIYSNGWNMWMSTTLFSPKTPIPVGLSVWIDLLAIIRFYTSIEKESDAMGIINLMLQRGLKLKYCELPFINSVDIAATLLFSNRSPSAEIFQRWIVSWHI